eukprot:1749160-Rhodomonas_salina.1
MGGADICSTSLKLYALGLKKNWQCVLVWMQMVGRVYPVQSYLKRVGLAPNNHCPWCRQAKHETLEHFLSDCKHFWKHCTKVHNDISAAVLDQLRTLKPQGWEFLPKTELCKLPQSSHSNLS